MHAYRLNSLAKTVQRSSRRGYYVPLVIDSDGRFERAMDIYSRLLKERIIQVGWVECNLLQHFLPS